MLNVKKAIGKGIDGLIIDPWNELEMILRAGETETDYICRSLTNIRRFSRKNNIATFVVAHPAKMFKPQGKDKYDVPTLYNIAGSAHWYNKADNGITIYRNFDADEIEVHIQKVKFSVHGKIGVVEMKYDNTNGRYCEIPLGF